MMPLVKLLWAASAIGAGSVLWKIYRSQNLRVRYRWFAGMLLISLVRDAILWFVPYGTDAYGICWMATLACSLFGQALAAIELCHRLSSLYAKIGSFRYWLFGGCALAAAAVCVLVVPVEYRNLATSHIVLRWAFLVDQCVHSLLAGMLIFSAFFFQKFPPPLKKIPPNVSLHSKLLSLYLGSVVLARLADNFVPLKRAVHRGGTGNLAVDPVEAGHLALVSVIYFVYAWRLSENGELSLQWPKLDEETIGLINERNEKILSRGRKLSSKAWDQARK
jgi:hypothetical protein